MGVRIVLSLDDCRTFCSLYEFKLSLFCDEVKLLLRSIVLKQEPDYKTRILHCVVFTASFMHNDTAAKLIGLSAGS